MLHFTNKHQLQAFLLGLNCLLLPSSPPTPPSPHQGHRSCVASSLTHRENLEKKGDLVQLIIQLSKIILLWLRINGADISS